MGDGDSWLCCCRRCCCCRWGRWSNRRVLMLPNEICLVMLLTEPDSQQGDFFKGIFRQIETRPLRTPSDHIHVAVKWEYVPYSPMRLQPTSQSSLPKILSGQRESSSSFYVFRNCFLSLAPFWVPSHTNAKAFTVAATLSTNRYGTVR